MRPHDIEKRKQERHLRKAQVRRQRNLRLILLFVVIVVGFFGAIKLYNSPVFSIKTIDISGNTQLSKERVSEISKVKTGENLLRLPVKAIQERLEADPWVREVTIRKLLPQGLRIEVHERAPVAMILADGGRAVVDKDSYVTTVFPEKGRTPFDGLPKVEAPEMKTPVPGRLLRHERAREAISVLTSLDPALRGRVRNMVLGGPEELRFYLSNEIEILFGSIRLQEEKNRLLAQILHEYATRRQVPVYIDVRTPRNPVTRDLPSASD